MTETQINKLIENHDAQNLAKIEHALHAGKINREAADYLIMMYSDSARHFKQIFNIMGECFGAPKAAVLEYNTQTWSAIDNPIKIADINPMSSYIVHHRLDIDPMRNQFFTADRDNHIDLAVSSIVSIIIASQKSIERAIEKLTGKYYDRYTTKVIRTVKQIITDEHSAANANAVATKIKQKFDEKFITSASEMVLQIIGKGHESIAVKLVREIDDITPPHYRLRDIYRVKCLFDLIPQARTFIERLYEVAPHRIITMRDKFYDIEHERNYRDAKIILDLGTANKKIPLEVICQVRTFFNYEIKNHDEYVTARKSGGGKTTDIAKNMAKFYENGIAEYNKLICDCVEDLFERVGWNILYGQSMDEKSFFDGFPQLSKFYYDADVVESVIENLDKAVQNEVFTIPNAPIELSKAQEFAIFRWMAKFILISAIPYKSEEQKIEGDGISARLFNFVMGTLHRQID